MKLKVVICGGHLTPALGLIEYLEKRKDYQIYYIGRKYALEGDKALSLEYLTIRKMGLPFYVLHFGRLQRSFTRYTLLSLAKLPASVVQCFFILHKIKPAVIVSFGGYVALPICVSAWVLGIPIITHEQTHILGLSNRIIGRFAKVLALSWEETKYLSPGGKTAVTGNPVSEYKYLKKGDNFLNFGNQSLPLIYITGGSLGSAVINKIIEEILPDLSSRFRIIHQTGSANNEKDFQRLQKLKNLLPKLLQRNYKLVKHIDPTTIGSILSSCQLVIGRAGANTVFEVQYTAKVAIFIPLPWSADNEQEENSRRLANFGSVVVIKQDKLTSKLLLNTIDSIFNNFLSYEEKAKMAKKGLILDGAKRLTKLIGFYAKSETAVK